MGKIFLLFHIAVPLLVFEIPYIKKYYRFNRLALIIGSLFPDFVDKPLAILGVDSGRGYGHTLIGIIVCFLLVSLITRGNKEISFSFLIGLIFHLVLDLPYVPLFYPFVQYNLPISDDPIANWWTALLTDPLVISTEIAGLIIGIFIIYHHKLYNFNALKQYLKTTPIITNEESNLTKDTNNILKNNSE